MPNCRQDIASSVHLCLEFVDVSLPIAIGCGGHEVVPVKPIAEALGVAYHHQFVKCQRPNIAARLGVEKQMFFHKGRYSAMTCIRLDRVPSFLLLIDANRVRRGGNREAADFLERKHAQFDELISRGLKTKRH